MRNILVHQYFGIDPDAVWEAVQNSLIYIKQRAQEILDSEE